MVCGREKAKVTPNPPRTAKPPRHHQGKGIWKMRERIQSVNQSIGWKLEAAIQEHDAAKRAIERAVLGGDFRPESLIAHAQAMLAAEKDIRHWHDIMAMMAHIAKEEGTP